MSREQPRKKVPGLLDNSDWTPEASRKAGPRAYAIAQEVPYIPIEIESDPEVGVRNRSGERRRTGKTIKSRG